MPSLLNDNECDAMCNVESCDFDRGDCFHDNTECYRRSDGADYRGIWNQICRGPISRLNLVQGQPPAPPLCG